MTHVTCRLTARNRDQLRNPTLGNQLVTFMNHSQSLAMRGQTIFWWHRIDTAVARHHISHGVCVGLCRVAEESRYCVVADLVWHQETMY